MYNHLHYFRIQKLNYALVLPFEIDDIVESWDNLRNILVRKMPPEFTRDEWAYLMAFLSEENLISPFINSFGERVESNKLQNTLQFNYLIKPRGLISLWLPNNVSLLGPLMLILLSLSGNSIRMKGGSRGENLTGIFLDCVMENLTSCSLLSYLREKVSIEFFDHSDTRHREMAKEAKIRIFFGSNESARTIEELPHSIDSMGIYFTHKQSEAWIEKAALNEYVIKELIKIFAIYGQVGCTSPKRVILINGTVNDAEELREKIKDMWPNVIKKMPAQYVASNNIMAKQWASALGWKADLSISNSAVLASGEISLELPDSNMFLPIMSAPLEKAISRLPENIQTIGYAFADLDKIKWLKIITRTSIKRLVPLSLMHHFSHIWDGFSFWRQLFEEIEVQI